MLLARYTLILHPRLSTILIQTYRKQLSITPLQQFRQKANTSTNHKHLSLLLQSYLQQSSQKSQALAIGCRNYSRIFRRVKNSEAFQLQRVFGWDYEQLEKVQLERLSITELVDIAVFVNVVALRWSVEIGHPVLRGFVERLLKLTLDKLEEKGSNNPRQLADLAKCARCAQVFNSPLYPNFLNQILSTKTQTNSFEALSLFNSILRGKNSSICTELQLLILEKILKAAIADQWVKMLSVHSFVDFVNPVSDVLRACGFLGELRGLYGVLEGQMREGYQREFRGWSGEEIIRVNKLLLEGDYQSPAYTQLLTLLLTQIKPTGESTIDPIFLIRLISYCKHFPLLPKLTPSAQSQLLNLLTYYLTTQQIQSKLVLTGLAQNLHEGLFSYGDTRQFLERLAKRIRYGGRDGDVEGRYYADTVLYRLCVRFGLYELAGVSLAAAVRGFTDGGNWAQLFLLMQQLFLEEVGANNKPRGVFKTKQQPPTPQQQKKQQTKCQQLQTLILSLCESEIDKASAQSNPQANIHFLSHILSCLFFTYQYELMVKILKKIQISHSSLEIVSREVFMLCVPRGHRQAMIETMYGLYRGRDGFGQHYGWEIQKDKNQNMRCSQLQAEFFLEAIRSLTPSRRMAIYGNHCVCRFLMIFARDAFMRDVEEIIKGEGLGPENYEFLYLRMLWVMVEKCADEGQIAGLVSKLASNTFASKLIAKYFAQIVLDNSLLEPADLTQFLSRNGIDQQTLTQKQNLKDYRECIKRLQSDPTQASIQKYLALLQENLKKECTEGDRKLFIRDFLRIAGKITWKQYQGKMLDFMGQLSKSLPLQWQVRVLQLSLKVSHPMPKLYTNIWQTSRNDQQWKTELKAPDLFTLLLTYPAENKWTVEFIQALLNILRYCPEEAGKLEEKLGQAGSTDVRNYLRYVRKMVQGQGQGEIN